MTQKHPDKAPPALSAERLQSKADILENNLFSHITKQKNRIRVDLTIDRKLYPDTVTIKALLQLFPRINIKGKKILLLLRKLMARQIPEDNNLHVRKSLFAMPDNEDPDLARLGIVLDMTLTRTSICIAIEGVPETPSRHGAIQKAYFDHESCPGQLLSGGKIDFREINKYPIVKAGDDLFYISAERQGRPGMTYDGQIIRVEEAKALRFKLLGGIDLVDHRDEKGRYLGYHLKAATTGVVVLSRSHGRITDLGITGELDVRRLDYATGNIGTRFICPISMKVDTICNGFRIRAKGTVEVNILDGGEIETECHAVARVARTGSRITAAEDIICAQCMQSELNSGTGCVHIREELIDSRVFSKTLRFEKSRGIMTGSRVDAEYISLDGVLFCGENTLFFGRRLMAEKRNIRDELKKVEQDRTVLEQMEKSTLESLQTELVRLTKIIRTHPGLRENMKQLILAAQTQSLDTLRSQLDIIGRDMNTKEVSNIGKLVDALEALPGKHRGLDERKQALDYDLAEIKKRMSGLHLSVEGYLRRAATLTVYSGAPDGDTPPKPELTIESEHGSDTFIKVVGTWSPREGFTVKRL